MDRAADCHSARRESAGAEPGIRRCSADHTVAAANHMNRSKVKILVVDDEQGLCAGLQEALRREGYLVDAMTDSDRKSTRLNSSHLRISDAVFCLKQKAMGDGRPEPGLRSAGDGAGVRAELLP